MKIFDLVIEDWEQTGKTWYFHHQKLYSCNMFIFLTIEFRINSFDNITNVASKYLSINHIQHIFIVKNIIRYTLNIY